MACVYFLIFSSVESPLHFFTCKHTRPLSIPKRLVLALRFSPSRSYACLVSSKLSVLCTSTSSSHAISSIQSHPLLEEEEEEEEEEGAGEVEKRQLSNGDITEFLMKEFGVSETQLLSSNGRTNVPLSKLKSTYTAQQALQLFRDLEFTPEQVGKIIRRFPGALTLKVDGLKRKIDLLATIGLTGKDLTRVIAREPRILGLSLENNLGPKLRLYQNLFGSKADLFQAILRAPQLLFCNKNVSEYAAKKLKQIESIGFVEDEIKEMFKKNPKLLCSTTETLDKKLKHITRIGLTNEELKVLLMRHPFILSLSVDQVQKNVEFLTSTVGFQPNILLKYPGFLLLSVENRLKPRFKFYVYLTEMHSSKALPYSLSTLLGLSERAFSKKFPMFGL